MKVSDSKHRLLELMQYYNITQQDIADKTGVKKSAISMYVKGDRLPRQDKISMICDAYDLDPAWLMGYDVPMKRVRTPDGKYTTESALLVSQIRSDKEFTEAAKIYFSLPDTKKKLIVDLIKNMAE